MIPIENEAPRAGWRRGGRSHDQREQSTDRNQIARGGKDTSPLRVTQELREAIRKKHPIESAFLEYLLEKADGRVVLVTEGTL